MAPCPRAPPATASRPPFSRSRSWAPPLLPFCWLRPASVRREAGLDVLLVTVDTLRADALGSYGRKGAETTRMDRLAAQGVRFDFAHAHNVVTLPSHANILSGRYAFDHGIRENSGFRFPAGVETLATLLRRHGYRTGAFVSAFPLDSRFGLDRGFEVYDDQLGGVAAGGDFEMQERSGEQTVAAARAWLARTKGPRFCWVHLYEPHAPYAPPFEWRGRVPTAYDGEVAATDAALAPAPRSDPRGGPPPGARWWCSPPTTARASASTARRPTASSPTRRPCACPWCSTALVSSRRGWWPRACATSTCSRRSSTPSLCPSSMACRGAACWRWRRVAPPAPLPRATSRR